MRPQEIIQLVNNIHSKYYPDLDKLSKPLNPPLSKRNLISNSYMYSELSYQTNSEELKPIYKLLAECYWTLLLDHKLDIAQDYDLHQQYLKGCRQISKFTKQLNL